jgi:peroxiredoxin
MKSRVLFVAMTLTMAFAVWAEERGGSSSPSPEPATRHRTDMRAAEPPIPRVRIGDPAPNFAFIAADGKWRRLSDLLAQGPVLLVFGARDADLRAIEAARPAFRELEVVPAAVMDMRSGSIGSLAKRLGLTFPILSDSQRAIAELFNTVDPASHRHSPSFFVVDRLGTVRHMGRGMLPDSQFLVESSALGLGKPVPDMPQTAQSE